MLETSIRKILIGVTGEDDMEAALRFAADESRRRGVGVHLVHVVHPVVLSPDGVPLTVEEHAVRKYGAKALADAATALEHELGDEQPVTTEMVHGTAAKGLIETAAHAGLVVLQHERMGRPGIVPTLSTTHRVAALSPAPVVAVPAGWTESPDRRDVAVGVADPERSGQVVRAALEEARRRGARLRVLHAVHYGDAYEELVFAGEAGPRHDAEKAQALTAGVGPLLADHPDVEVELIVRRTRTADALVAESRAVALLIVGRHRHSTHLGPHLGSVARAVLRHAECPVMVVDPVA